MRFLNHLPVNRNTLIAATAGFALLAGGAYLWRDGTASRIATVLQGHANGIGAQQGLALANVAVTGREHQNKESILAALGVQRGTPMLDIDLDAARTRLEALPWIETAEIERQLPDTLFIRITERTPFAFWQKGGKLSLIDRDGAVIAIDNPNRYAPLVVLVGDDAPAAAVPLLDMLNTQPALARRVNAAILQGDRRWDLRFDSGVIVSLPQENADAAWRRLAAMESQQQVLERNIVSIDMRLPDRLVIRAMPDTTKKPPLTAARKNS